jgi:hypothetical protein
MDGVHLICKSCGLEFRVCRKCWRGQNYCSKICSKIARTLSSRKSQKKYSRTPKGRQSHRLKQKRYRKKSHRHKNSETDQTTASAKTPVNHEQRKGRCVGCGMKILTPIAPIGFYSFRRSDSKCLRPRFSQKF